MLPRALRDAAAAGLHSGAEPLQVTPAGLDRRNDERFIPSGAQRLLCSAAG
jgi:hypothetical protein